MLAVVVLGAEPSLLVGVLERPTSTGGSGGRFPLVYEHSLLTLTLHLSTRKSAGRVIVVRASLPTTCSRLVALRDSSSVTACFGTSAVAAVRATDVLHLE